MEIQLISNVQIISRATNEEECKIKTCKIEFEPAINFSSVSNQLEHIQFELEDKFEIYFTGVEFEKINFNQSNINNFRPYIFKFSALIDKMLYTGMIEDAWINHPNETLDDRITRLNLKTRAGSKLILEKIPTK